MRGAPLKGGMGGKVVVADVGAQAFGKGLQGRKISKERTEGGLNKRASLCALLFSTLLVFPN